MTFELNNVSGFQTFNFFIRNVLPVDRDPASTQCVWGEDRGVNSQSDEEGVVDLCQNLLLVVDVLLLLQSDHVRDPHLLQGVEGPALLVLDQEDSAKSPSAWGREERGGRGEEWRSMWGLTTMTGIQSTQTN